MTDRTGPDLLTEEDNAICAMFIREQETNRDLEYFRQLIKKSIATAPPSQRTPGNSPENVIISQIDTLIKTTEDLLKKVKENKTNSDNNELLDIAEKYKMEISEKLQNLERLAEATEKAIKIAEIKNEIESINADITSEKNNLQNNFEIHISEQILVKIKEADELFVSLSGENFNKNPFVAIKILMKLIDEATALEILLKNINAARKYVASSILFSIKQLAIFKNKIKFERLLSKYAIKYMNIRQELIIEFNKLYEEQQTNQTQIEDTIKTYKSTTYIFFNLLVLMGLKDKSISEIYLKELNEISKLNKSLQKVDSRKIYYITNALVLQPKIKGLKKIDEDIEKENTALKAFIKSKPTRVKILDTIKRKESEKKTIEQQITDLKKAPTEWAGILLYTYILECGNLNEISELFEKELKEIDNNTKLELLDIINASITSEETDENNEYKKLRNKIIKSLKEGKEVKTSEIQAEEAFMKYIKISHIPVSMEVRNERRILLLQFDTNLNNLLKENICAFLKRINELISKNNSIANINNITLKEKIEKIVKEKNIECDTTPPAADSMRVDTQVASSAADSMGVNTRVASSQSASMPADKQAKPFIFDTKLKELNDKMLKTHPAFTSIESSAAGGSRIDKVSILLLEVVDPLINLLLTPEQRPFIEEAKRQSGSDPIKYPYHFLEFVKTYTDSKGNGKTQEEAENDARIAVNALDEKLESEIREKVNEFNIKYWSDYSKELIVSLIEELSTKGLLTKNEYIEREALNRMLRS